MSHKLAAPGHDLGTLTGDSRQGVSGVLGALPPRVSLGVSTRDTDTGATHRVVAEVADETDVGLPSGVSPISVVAPMTLAQAAYAALDGAPVRQSARLCVRIGLRELPKPTGFCNRYVGSSGGGDGSTGGLYVSDLADALVAVDAFVFGTPHVVSVEADLRLARGLQHAYLTSVSGPKVLRRGKAVTLRIGTQRVRGAASSRTVRLTVPRDLPRGPRVLTLTGTPADDAANAAIPASLFGAEEGGEGGDPNADDQPPSAEAGPRTLKALAARIAGLERFDGVKVSFREPGAPTTGSEGSGDAESGRGA